jgi:hypothetical protein
MVGQTFPDIIWDGIMNKEIVVDGKLPEGRGVYIENNTKEDGELTFANLNAGALLKGELPEAAKRDLAEHAGSLPALEPVKIPGVE